MIEKYEKLALHGRDDKIVAAYFNDDLDSFFAHGLDFSKPFAAVSKRTRRWGVSHTPTGRRIGTRPLNFQEALECAALLERTLEGASQIEHRGEMRDVVGLTRESAKRAHDALLAAGYLP